MARIAISAATGELGGLVARALLDEPGGDDVVLLARRPGAVAGDLAARAEVRRADLDEPASLAAALAGVDRLLLVSTTHAATGRRVQQHGAAIDAAVQAGLEHVAFTSMPRVTPDHPGGLYAQEYRETEELLASRDIGWTVLQNGPYAENLVTRAREAIATGVLTSNAGTGRAAYVAKADCAAVAAAVLAGEGHAGRTYVVTGEQRWTQGQLAELLREVSGRPVALRELDDTAHEAHLRDSGVPEPLPRLLANHHVAVRRGFFDDRTAVVHELTGRPATSLAEVLRAHTGAPAG